MAVYKYAGENEVNLLFTEPTNFGKSGIYYICNIKENRVAQLINPNPNGDTPKTVEDKTRNLPANQGLNEWDMWQKVDTEVVSAGSAGKLRNVENYKSGNIGDKHGAK